MGLRVDVTCGRCGRIINLYSASYFQQVDQYQIETCINCKTKHLVDGTNLHPIKNRKSKSTNIFSKLLGKMLNCLINKRT